MFDAKRIKLLAKEGGISLTTVATETGITKQYLSKLIIENSNFTVDKFVKFYDYFYNYFIKQNKILNSNWYLTGKGSMFLTSDNQDDNVMVIKLKKGQSVKIVYEE